MTSKTTEVELNVDRPARVFISYSRQDSDLATQLASDLETSGFETYFDRDDILAGEPWQERLARLIETADAVIALVTPAALASQMCNWEINEAERQSKRLLPVIARDVPDAEMPGRLKRLNYIFLRDVDDRASELKKLAQAVVTDIAWVREHTRLGDLATRWNESGRPRYMLLAKPELIAAEAWRDSRVPTAPDLTGVQLAWINESRINVGRSLRKWIVGSSFVSLVLLATSVFAVIQRNQAVVQRDNALIGQSRFLADLANQKIDDGDAQTAALLALAALPDADTSQYRPYEPAAETSLLRALYSDRETRVFAERFDGSNYPITEARFSADGAQVLAVSLDGRAYVWDGATGRKIATLQLDRPIKQAWYADDGKRIFTTTGGEIEAWSDIGVLEKNLVVDLAADPETENFSAAFSLDTSGEHLAVLTADGEVLVFDARTFDRLSVVKPQGRPILVRFLASKVVIASVLADNKVLISDGITDAPIATLVGHEDVVNSVDFSSDGMRIVTGSGFFDPTLVKDATARVWDARSGVQIAQLTGHRARVRRAAFGPDGTKVITVSDDGTVRVWDAQTGQQKALISEPGRDATARFSPDGQSVVTTNSDGKAKLFWANGKLRVTFGSHEGPVTGAGFDRDGRTLATWSDDGTVRLWKTGYPAGFIGAPDEGYVMSSSLMISDMKFSPDSRQLLVANRYGVDLVSSQTGQKIATLPVDGFPIKASFDLTGNSIVTASDDLVVRTWDVARKNVIASFELSGARPIDVMTTPGGGVVVAAATADNVVEIWDVGTAGVVGRFAGHTDQISTIALSDDRKYVAAGSKDHSIRVWDYSTGALIKVLVEDDQSQINNVAFSHDGVSVISSSSRSLKIWNFLEGVATNNVDSGALKANFDLDDGRVITADREGTATIRAAGDLKPLYAFDNPEMRSSYHLPPMAEVAFSPDGRFVADSDSNGNVRIWRFFSTLEGLVSYWKDKSTRCLSEEQRAAAFLDTEPAVWCGQLGKWPNEAPQLQE